MRGRSTTDDPLRLREAALAASAMAVGLGWVLGESRAGRVAARGVAVAAAAGGIALAVSGRRWVDAASPRARDGLGGATSRARDGLAVAGCPVDIRIPARDEARVIGDVIADLGRQVPPDGFRLTVIDDRSTDGTGSVARAAIEAAGLGRVARVVRRVDGPDGKAAALAAADDGWNVGTGRGATILVLDADARVDPGFVGRATLAIANGTPIATARRRVRRPAAPRRIERLLVDAQATEQSADHVLQRGRLAVGGAAELRGNGLLIRTDVLGALDGWPVDALAEDLELASRTFLATGHGAERPAGFEVWEQAPSTLGTVLRQRLRWAEGSVRRDLAVVLPAVTDATIPPRRRLDATIAAAQDLAPWVGIGLLASGARRGSVAAGAELVAGYGVAAAALALAADEPDLGPARRVASLLALGAGWAAILPVAWLRVVRNPARPAFRPTAHRPDGDFATPTFATPLFRTTAPPQSERPSPSASRRGTSGRSVATSHPGAAAPAR